MTCILHSFPAPDNVGVFPGNDDDDSSYGFFFDDDQDVDDQSSMASSSFDSYTGVAQLYGEPSDVMHRHPPLLSHAAMEQIMDHQGSSPSAAVYHQRWRRLYSTSRDGSSFATFLRNVRGRHNTIIIAKTELGQVVGACATRPWSGRSSGVATDGHAEQRPFLFSIGPAHEELSHRFIPSFEWDEEDQVIIHECRDKDGEQYEQTCKIGDKSIAMRSRNFALSIYGSFARGSIQGQDFAVVDFECYSLD